MPPIHNLKRSDLVACFVLALATASVAKTTKGLNQIVTPDIQQAGQFSISFQYVNPAVGNSFQDQLELGITKQFEIAVFNGYKPGTQYLSTEIGLIQQKNWLLSTGFLTYSTRHDVPQPFLEAGYYKGNVETMAGVQFNGFEYELILGGAYQLNPRLQLMVDYLSGRSNFSTYGFTYAITKNLTINPALYVSNGSGKLFPYAVLTWTIMAWKA
ncbi:MAG TPA: hypothetical protein VGL56_07750 [Fimbriimonadaceae bacterium]|jgi:hypothetical protein